MGTNANDVRVLTLVVVVPAVDSEVVVAGDGDDGWQGRCRVGIGAHVGDRGVGQEFHHHT